MDKKYIDKFIDTEYFNFPKGFFKSFYYSYRLHYSRVSIELLNPCLVICNKSTEFDEYLLRQTISTDYVVLKNKYINQIYSETLSAIDKENILANIKVLKEALISVVIFPEQQISIFGSSQYLPEKITEFLYETGMNLKFINFANAYFAKPIWATKYRFAPTFYHSSFNISNKLLSTLTKDERNSKINKSMPSSASIYGHKSHLNIRSNNLADGLESIVFACPNCNELFSLKSEFHHLKCSNCQIPFECTHSGDIYTNGQIISFDDLEKFLYNILKTKNFVKNEVATYNNVTFSVFIRDEPIHKIENLKLDIFSNRLKLKGIDFEKFIEFKDIISYEYLPSNTLKFTLKTTEVFSITPKFNENMYIIYSLIDLRNKKTQH